MKRSPEGSWTAIEACDGELGNFIVFRPTGAKIGLFDRAFPLDDKPCFPELITAIDEAEKAKRRSE